ncbi:MAG: DUF262 domain-containing protein [Myxococcota bacterium]
MADFRRRVVASTPGNSPMPHPDKLVVAPASPAEVHRANAPRFEEWSVRRCIRESASLFIPAFQRGAVWDSAGSARLLESLAGGMFIGSLLVWEADEAQDGAVPLRADTAEGPNGRRMLIDGQQRLRSLLDTLLMGGRVERSPHSEYASLWFVQASDHLSLPLSFKHLSVKSSKKKHWVPVLLLEPIRALRAEEDAAMNEARLPWESLEQWRDEFDGAPSPAVIEALECRLRHLLETKVPVTILPEGRWQEGQVVENFRRLNEYGSRLRKEELEFARLVEASDGQASVSAHLASVIRDRPGGDSGRDRTPSDHTDTDDGDIAERDAVLERGDHRAFGLKLFIRTVQLVRDYYENHREETGKRLPESSELGRFGPGWMKTATAVLKCLGRAMQELGCDEPRRIPRDAFQEDRLMAVLLLLIRFPALREEAAWPVVKALTVRALLAHEPGCHHRKTTEDIYRDVLEFIDAAKAARHLSKWWGSGSSQVLPDGSVIQDTSPQSRYVQMLYWLLRKRGARDVPPPGVRGAQPLCAEGHCEKQHIIPFSRVMYNEGERPSRTSQHIVNSVGNLTWLTHASNTFRGGWGDDFMGFWGDERDSNRDAHDHFILEKSGGEPESWPYADIRRVHGTREDAEHVPLNVVRGFARRRAGRIAAEFRSWIDAEDKRMHRCLDELPAEFLGGPEQRTANVLDLTLSCGYPLELARLIARLVEKGGYAHGSSAPRWRSAETLRLRWQTKDHLDVLQRREGVTLQLRMPDGDRDRHGHHDGAITLRPDGLALQLHDERSEFTADSGFAGAVERLRDLTHLL